MIKLYNYLNHQFTKFVIKLLAFYYSLVNYTRVMAGKNIVNYKDVKIDISLIYKDNIAPYGFVFYIAKIKIGTKKYSKNVAIYRKNIPLDKERILKYKVQIIFANMVTKQINK